MHLAGATAALAAPKALPAVGTGAGLLWQTIVFNIKTAREIIPSGMSQDSALKAEESQKAGLTSDLQSLSEEMPVLAQSPLLGPFLLLLFLLINCSVHQHAGSALGWLSGRGCDAPDLPLLHVVTVRCWGWFCGDLNVSRLCPVG